ncbi:ABC transporter ATP-binding protein [Arcanobacterium buesumense]|uniref:ABC transporter ATP-binding protein n=1 Tax=Arcanobacterium buesumense TaxID=2722751 RepID=A0A6H2EJE8_9ACTO|nr:ABC transporter ATP-binding protein [Arcanobacterium buesumense]QJC21456.1 ABC transporter ATP-binding protein [Arcanobacterium buesumense]
MLKLRDITRTVTLPNGEDLHILRGVNCDIASGEHISIVGHSGTGKSTLLNIIGLLDQPTSGIYQWDETDVLSLSDGQRSRLRGSKVGFVFQQFNLFPSRTILNNVEVPLFYNSGLELYQRHEKAAYMLESVGLGDRLDAFPSQLSGGEQQRVAIARALIRNPHIILADEPTGALDPETGMQVMDVLERAAKAHNSALIVISHDVNVAQRASTVYQISNGVLHNVTGLADPFGFQAVKEDLAIGSGATS